MGSRDLTLDEEACKQFVRQEDQVTSWIGQPRTFGTCH